MCAHMATVATLHVVGWQVNKENSLYALFQFFIVDKKDVYKLQSLL